MALQWRVNLSANGGESEIALARSSTHVTAQGMDFTLVTPEGTRARSLTFGHGVG